MSSIEIENVYTEYCLENIDLNIKNGELLVLLGPSGAGKTSLLNVIAGLEKYKGSVFFENKLVNDIPANQRGVGYLFQDINLFPHLNVYENIAFGLKMKNTSANVIKDKVTEMVHLLNIESLIKRYPKNLSGGEKQRAALARALITSPQILLLDEPLSSLDYRISKYLRTEIKILQKKLGITTIYVTHNFYEAEEMADRIAVISNGKVSQIDIPENVFFKPSNKKVSNFIGEPNIFNCSSYTQINPFLKELKFANFNLVVASEKKCIEKIAILPEDIYLSSTKPPGPNINRIKGVLTDIQKKGNNIHCIVQAGERIKVKIPAKIFENMCLNKGDKVWMIFNLRKIKVLDGDLVE